MAALRMNENFATRTFAAGLGRKSCLFHCKQVTHFCTNYHSSQIRYQTKLKRNIRD